MFFVTFSTRLRKSSLWLVGTRGIYRCILSSPSLDKTVTNRTSRRYFEVAYGSDVLVVFASHPSASKQSLSGRTRVIHSRTVRTIIRAHVRLHGQLLCKYTCHRVKYRVRTIVSANAVRWSLRRRTCMIFISVVYASYYCEYRVVTMFKSQRRRIITISTDFTARKVNTITTKVLS